MGPRHHRRRRRSGHPCLHRLARRSPPAGPCPLRPRRRPSRPPRPRRPRRPRPPRWTTPARIWPSSTSPRTRRASAAARCPARHGVAAAPSIPPGNRRGPAARGAPGTKACPRRGRTPAPASQRASFSPSHPGMLCLSNQRALSRPTGPKPGEEATGCLSPTPCSWPCHFIHFQTPTAFCLAVPAGPVPHNTSRLCLKARINKRKQSARLRAWSCGNARGCASACVAGHLPGKSGPAPSFSSRQGPQAEPLPLPSVKGPHSQGYLDRCFCLEVAGRVWRGNQPGCAGRPSPVRLCGRGWGDRRASRCGGL